MHPRNRQRGRRISGILRSSIEGIEPSEGGTATTSHPNGGLGHAVGELIPWVTGMPADVAEGDIALEVVTHQAREWRKAYDNAQVSV